MIETFEPVGAHDARLARGAALGSQLLAAFNEAGVVAAGDLHVATTVADLVGELDETVRLAVALTVGAVRAGSAAVRAIQSGFLRYYAALLLVGVTGLGLYFLIAAS